MNLNPRILTHTERVVSALESASAPLRYHIGTFLAAITLRTFLESLSTRSDLVLAQFVHYSLFYTSLALWFIFSSQLLMRTGPARIARVVLPSFLLLLVTPIVDMVWSGGARVPITYFPPDHDVDLSVRFLTLGGPYMGFGVSPGMKVEIALALVAAFLYGRVKTGGLLRSLFLPFLFYIVIFAHGSVLLILKNALKSIGLDYRYSDTLLDRAYMIGFLIPGSALWFLSDRRCVVAILRDLRLTRVAHYLLMFAIGLALASTERSVHVDSEMAFRLMLIPAAILFAILFSIVTNNIADEHIDRISNATRPLVAGTVDRIAYRRAGRVFLLLSAAYSLAAGFWAFLAVFSCIAAYFIYSMPPIRLKRVSVFSKIVISASSLLLVILGWRVGGMRAVAFPRAASVYMLVCFMLCASFIDLKDTEGDRAGGIRTLPVILGQRRAGIVVAAFFIVTYAALLNLAREWYVIATVVFLAIAQAAFLSRNSYQERPVMAIHLLSLILFLGYVLFVASPLFLRHGLFLS